MGLADRPSQAVLRPRRRNQISVVGHEAVGPNLHPALPAPLSHLFHVGRIVLVVKKRLLSAVPTLRYVMRQTRSDQSR